MIGLEIRIYMVQSQLLISTTADATLVCKPISSSLRYPLSRIASSLFSIFVRHGFHTS
jgi:hypothetical protein